MKITKTQLRNLIKEELETTIAEVGFFKRLGNELTGKTKKTSKIASKIFGWMRDNDLVGRFGPKGDVGLGTRSGKGWESQNDVFDWAQENFEAADALSSGVGKYGFVRKGFEDDPRIKAARDFHDIPRDAAIAASQKRQDAETKERAIWKRDRALKQRAADREAAAAAEKKEEEEMESFRINQAGEKEQREYDERSYQAALRQRERNIARYGPQDYIPRRRVRENKKVTKK